MTWGLFKKVVIADRLALIVNQIYNNPQAFPGLPLIAGTVFFAFQIYCDFSGYSDIAIGSAQVMGFRLMDNFNRPYFSKSISEFWKRWHISLSSWFRDYLYIPMGGSRVSKWQWQYNVFITFLVSGLWHGANWTYVIWGALNGFYLIFSIWTGEKRKKIADYFGLNRSHLLHKIARVFITFLLVCFAWIFFRANSLTDALYIIGHLFYGARHIFDLSWWKLMMPKNGLNEYDYLLSVLSIIFLLCVHLLQRHGSMRHMLAERSAKTRWLVYLALLLGILFFGVFNRSQFIYFQF